jgi:hypothetical protein
VDTGVKGTGILTAAGILTTAAGILTTGPESDRTVTTS